MSILLKLACRTPDTCMQEYLDAARKGGELGRTAGVPFKFLFYLHRDQDDEKEDAADGNPTSSLHCMPLPCILHCLPW